MMPSCCSLVLTSSWRRDERCERCNLVTIMFKSKGGMLMKIVEKLLGYLFDRNFFFSVKQATKNYARTSFTKSFFLYVLVLLQANQILCRRNCMCYNKANKRVKSTNTNIKPRKSDFHSCDLWRQFDSIRMLVWNIGCWF